MHGQQSIPCLVNKADKFSPEKDTSHWSVVESVGETYFPQFPTFRVANCVVVVAAFSLSPGDGAKSTKQEYIEVSQSVRRANAAHNVCRRPSPSSSSSVHPLFPSSSRPFYPEFSAPLRSSSSSSLCIAPFKSERARQFLAGADPSLPTPFYVRQVDLLLPKGREENIRQGRFPS